MDATLAYGSNRLEIGHRGDIQLAISSPGHMLHSIKFDREVPGKRTETGSAEIVRMVARIYHSALRSMHLAKAHCQLGHASVR